MRRANDLSIFWNFVDTSITTPKTRQPPEGTQLLTKGEPYRWLRYGRASQPRHLYLEDDEPAAGYTARNLFANSPWDYTMSREVSPNIRSESLVKGFALTKAGIHFQAVIFDFVKSVGKYSRCYYAMNLDHSFSVVYGPQTCTSSRLMILEKIGPGLLVRRQLPPDAFAEKSAIILIKDRLAEPKNAYIVTNLTQSIKMQMQIESRHYAVRIEISGANDKSKARLHGAVEQSNP